MRARKVISEPRLSAELEVGNGAELSYGIEFFVLSLGYPQRGETDQMHEVCSSDEAGNLAFSVIMLAYASRLLGVFQLARSWIDVT